MEAQSDVKKIGPDNLQKWITQGRAITIINTLPGEEHAKRHIPSSSCACVYEITFALQVAEIVADKRRQIVLYGSSERSQDAAVAAEKLIRLGYENVYVLSGGLAAWKAAGYSLAGTEPHGATDPASALQLVEGTYRVDTQASVVEWTGRNPNGKHYGSIRLSGGKVTIGDAGIGGTFEIDMTSIKNDDLQGDELYPVLIDHLESDDFFFTKLFPRASFTITSATPVSGQPVTVPNFRIKGDLKLRGIRQQIGFSATFSTLADGAIAAEAHFDIDRTRWNIIYGSSRFFEHLGMHVVFDLISIQLRIVAR
jgi:polyisoprenoid-binding protein YceI